MEEKNSREKSFERLQEELKKAVQASKEKIQQWERFKTDYEALQARLYSLPDQLTHDVMIPFGKFAFMPGQIYHTNEILVLLGDNWFAKRSVKQALEIAERRKQNVIKMLEEERKQITDYEARQSFTADFKSVVEGHEDTVEIKEEYNQEQEERRKKRKAWVPKGGNVPPPRQVFPRQSSATGSNLQAKEKKSESQQLQSHEEVWKRLEELEKEEEAILAQEKDIEEDSDKITDRGCERTASSRHMVDPRNKNSEQGKDIGHGGPLRIAVKHTTPVNKEEENPTSENPGGDIGETKPMFRTPADIYQHKAGTSKKEKVPSEPKERASSQAAAKGVRWDPKLVSYTDSKDKGGTRKEAPIEATTHRPPVTQARAPMPFSGQVIERSSPAYPTPPPSSGSAKVSKFKASRQKK